MKAKKIVFSLSCSCAWPTYYPSESNLFEIDVAYKSLSVDVSKSGYSSLGCTRHQSYLKELSKQKRPFTMIKGLTQ